MKVVRLVRAYLRVRKKIPANQVEGFWLNLESLRRKIRNEQLHESNDDRAGGASSGANR